LFIFLFAVLCPPSLAALDNQLLKRLDLQRGGFTNTYQSFDIDGEPVIYVLQESSSAFTRGLAVLVSDNGSPLLGQEGFSALADELNKIGWVTILLSAPDTDFMVTIDQDIPTADEPKTALETKGFSEVTIPSPNTSIENLDISQSSVSTIDNLAFIKHEQQLVAFLQAAIKKSQDYPGFFLVISKGTSAAWLSKIYAENTLDAPDAFVAIGPYWPDRTHNQRLPQWMANTSMPVLDLHNVWDNRWARQTISQRQIEAVKALKLQYRQRELLGFNIHSQHNAYISKEIYGWISQMGW
jgi:hypothetical protein